MDSQPPTKKRRTTLEDKLKHGTNTHKLKEPCSSATCRLKCIDHIDQKRRIAIYLQFWSISYNERKNFVHHTVDKHEANPKTLSARRRAVSIKFF